MQPRPTATERLTYFWDDLADYLETYANAETPPEEDWEEWLRAMFPETFTSPFADHHREFWEWVWGLPPSRSMGGSYPKPGHFIAVWSRGGGKSTAGEAAIAALGALKRRRYVVVVCASQDQADKRIGEIARKLESSAIDEHYPALGQRAMSKHGSAKGWRRNRLHTASGLVVDGLGLDTAARGLKAEDQRPDLIILDDIDQRHDTKTMVDRNQQTITDTILPMGTTDVAVLGLQNLIIPHGVFARLVNGDADFLVDRIVSGPIQAIVDMKTENQAQEDGSIRTVITGGVATWEGQNLLDCQHLMDTQGPSSFLRECQHQVDEVPGAIWNMGIIDQFRTDENRSKDALDQLDHIAVGVDPQGVKKEGSETGIVVVARSRLNGHVYVLEDASINGTPDEWGRRAVVSWERWGASWVVGESNYGGEMVQHTVTTVNNFVRFKLVPTGRRDKQMRALPVFALYEQGKVHHVGRFSGLEAEMVTWDKDAGWSPNRLDALVHAVRAVVPELGGEQKWEMGYGKIRM